MKKLLILISIALSGAGGWPAYCQENDMIPKEEKIAVAPFATTTPEQEAEIRRLIENFVITEKENQARTTEELRSEKAQTIAEKDQNPTDNPFALDDTPPEVLKELQGYAKARTDAFKRLTALNELAFPILASHLDDKRPSSMHWNHTFAKTVGAICYRIIHDQLTEFPADYTEYGYQRIGRDGKSHVKPYWAGTPYDEADGLEKWLSQNKNLTYSEKRIKCLTWLLDEEKKIGVIDHDGYYVNILPLELEILKLKADGGQNVATELARARELSKTKPGSQVPKELMPDGPLPEIEEKHSLQETSAMLKSCPDGHTTLIDIPIIYGANAVLNKNSSDWDDEDKSLAKRRNAGEIILSGEPNEALDPRFRPTCQTCGYQYNVISVSYNDGNWFKKGRVFSDFTTPFSPVALSLPFAGMRGTDISVELTRKGQVVSESIEITIPVSTKNELLAKIEKWIDDQRFNRSLLHVETPPCPRLDEQPLENNRARFFIDVHTDPAKETTRLHFQLERSEDLSAE